MFFRKSLSRFYGFLCLSASGCLSLYLVIYLSLSPFSFSLSIPVCCCMYVSVSFPMSPSFCLCLSLSVSFFPSLSLLISSCHHSTLQKTPQCAIDINPGVVGVANNQNFGLGAWGFARRSVGEGGRKRVVKCYYNVFNKGVMFESGEKQACRSRHKWSILSRSFQKVCVND